MRARRLITLLTCAAAPLALAACGRVATSDARDPVTVLVLAPPPASAAPPVTVVAEEGQDPALAAWGSHASFEEVARVTETDAGAGHELSFDSLLEPLADESLHAACRPAEDEQTHVRARVAVLKGHAIGVTVEVEPDDPEVSRCLDRHIRTLAWDTSDRVQYVVKTW